MASRACLASRNCIRLRALAEPRQSKLRLRQGKSTVFTAQAPEILLIIRELAFVGSVTASYRKGHIPVPLREARGLGA